MAPTTFLALKEKNDALVISALDWLVLLHAWSPGASYMPTNLTDASGILQTLPAGWMTSGEIQKTAGVSLAPDTQTSAIEGYGSSGPRRTIVTAENFTVDYFAQEWRKINQELWHNTDLTTVSAAPGVGYKATKTSSLAMRFYSAIVIGQDFGSNNLFPFFMFPKVGVTRRAAMAGEQGRELGMPCTLTIYDDADYGGMYDFGVAGAGFDSIAQDAGFASAAVSITVNPSAVTLAAGELTQLTVIDNNGYNRTAECSFSSADDLVATVSSTGLVTAVATGGPTNITATLGALNDTCAVTVS
ncbi:Ig-like domain-containing protein [Nocardia otitidiscaviarum]|uniref:Ig-like domain-containing protein n=1 Tax=Nocardia otitidiscaviarum TaxID=1823 RepID=UPI0005B97299|nr:Ig-like domain-containing protein [Nocardia otitidiscaviarum]